MRNTAQFDNIKDMLPNLSKDAIVEVKDFVAFLLEKERKHNIFVNETLKVEQDSDTVKFDTAKEAMETIRNWS